MSGRPSSCWWTRPNRLQPERDGRGLGLSRVQHSAGVLVLSSPAMAGRGQLGLISELLSWVLEALPDGCVPIVQADRGIGTSPATSKSSLFGNPSSPG